MAKPKLKRKPLPPQPAPASADLRIEYQDIDSLEGAKRNPRKHDLAAIGAGQKRFGYTAPPLINEKTGRLVAGHGRLEALRRLRDAGEKPPERIKIGPKGEWMVPVVRGLSFKSEREAEAYLLADNRLAELTQWEAPGLRDLLREMDDIAGTGFDASFLERLDDEILGAKEQPPAGPKLSERFGVPPFTVLDARQGYWQERKRQWLSIGIRSEKGRDDNLLNFSDAVKLKQKIPAGKVGSAKAKSASINLTRQREGSNATGTGTSIFDPVLCELIYRWFIPPGGTILDPFAGGSVRGILAALLGHAYTGIELRGEQVAANREQLPILDAQAPAMMGAKAGAGGKAPKPTAPRWIEGDSRNIPTLVGRETFDFVFSCPPYYDLEEYSDDPADLSNAGTYAEFAESYRAIIAAAVERLKPNRFACFVVGDLRDKHGFYRNFVSDTIAAFERAGARLYNEAILVTAVGTLAMRVGVFFPKSRKLGKAHQNVLVFYKGDPNEIEKQLGPVEVEVRGEVEAEEP